MIRISMHGDRDDARRKTRLLVAMLTGRAADTFGVARGYLLSLGVGALSEIKDAFVTKSHGGTDEMGIKWPPLSAKYLAYGRRFERGEQAKLKRAAGLDRSHKFGVHGNKGLLNKWQRDFFDKTVKQQAARLMLSMSPIEAYGQANKIAWETIKRAGAKTKLEVYGSRQVDILRDTGVLLNSISPGIAGGDGHAASYTKPAGEGGSDQVFDIRAASVVVGTNVPYAGVHDKGHPAKPKMPRRQIFPDDAEQVPDAWWQRWLNTGARALEASAAIVFREAA